MKLSLSQAGQLMQLAGMLGQSVAGPDRRQQALLAQLTEMGKGIVQNEVMRQQAKQREKQQKKEKTSGILGTIGSIAGATLLPGVGAPIGAAIGGSLGRAAGGGEISLGSVAMDAAPSLMGMAGKSVGLTQGVTEGVGIAQGAAQGANVAGALDTISEAGLMPAATTGEILQHQAAAPLATEATQATAQAVTARAPWRERLAGQLQNVASYNRYGMGGLLGGAVQGMWGGQGGQGGQDYVEMIDEDGRPVRVRRIPWGGR